MTKEANENKLYRYFDRFVNGVTGTYRDLEDILGIDHVTIQRVVNESSDINATVKGKGNSKETRFILAKYETPVIIKMQKNETNTFVETKPKKEIMNELIETKEITFNTRQHRLCDYLLAKLKITNNYLDKVDILWELKEYYFTQEVRVEMPGIVDPYSGSGYMKVPQYKMFNLSVKEAIKKSRHNYAEYVTLTNDISFINLHGEIRQILIGSRGGKNGGVKALRLGEQYDAIDGIFGQGLKILRKAWAMKKAAEKHANTRMVFKNEKNLMNILREFDN